MRQEYIEVAKAGKCFWCECNGGRMTVDHLISRPLQEYIVANGKSCPRVGRTVRACKTCNFDRACLSTLFADVQRGKGEFDKAVAMRDKLKPIISRYVALVKQKLLDADLRDCQIELWFLIGLNDTHRERFGG